MDGTDSNQARIVFWTWLGMITVGLATMIILPLAGR